MRDPIETDRSTWWTSRLRVAWGRWAWIAVVLIAGVTSAIEIRGEDVGEVPTDVRKDLGLDPFYVKYLSVEGFPILGSARVSDAALQEAAWIVRKMLGHRPDILQAMTSNRTRMAVMGYQEYTTDVPEHRHLTPRVYWDRRARGLGATPEAPAVSCAEENLLGYPGDPYSTENICIHEFAHAIHEMGMSTIDPMFDPQLQIAYERALTQGLWKGTYAAVNRQEYWAEGVQNWFDDNRENDALHNHVNTRHELREYDPQLAELCQQVFGDGTWRYLKPEKRERIDREHVLGTTRIGEVGAEQPRFRWRDEPIPDEPKVLIQTELGDIELLLDARRAPQTVANFLHYVHQGWYADGSFHRTVRDDNQPDDEVRIAVIQGGANSAKKDLFPMPIPLERTSETGITHKHGTISMARDQEPDSGRDHFFICIGDQSSLDLGGKRNPDGQGFAAFGRVTKGMETVEKIHSSPRQGQELTPRIRIQRAIRLN